MFGLDALLTLFTYTLSIWQSIWGPAYEPDGQPLQLSHIVWGREQAAFTLHPQFRSKAYGKAFAPKRKIQRIPRFKYDGNNPQDVVESAMNEWRAGIEGVSVRSDPSQWSVEPVIVPDLSDKETVLTLAKIAANAYVPTPHEGDWSDVNGTDDYDWNHNGDGYGWDNDGVRGYIFTSEDLKTMVISIKGTSTAVLDNGGPTAPSDKINDNLFFSCCCARISYMWSTVCDCYLGNGQKCDQQCLERELWREDRYYRSVLQVYANARALVPEAETIWVAGHSLGGSLSSMLGRTYGLPAITFEAPGDRLPVRRLHLPAPPGIPPWDEFVWHFGHTADPIFMGTCNGGGSTCWLKGYAMETKCHSGMTCIYDVKKDLGWHDSVANHRIHVVIDNVIEKYDDPAICLPPPPCEDCSDWLFVDPLAAEPSSTEPSSEKPVTSKKPSSTRSSTSPKTTPKSTTLSTATTTTTMTSTLTSSCLHRAWYGQCTEWTTFGPTEVLTDAPNSTANEEFKYPAATYIY